jgi:mannose-6-phosphate isomerase-like protein (cupin superfamily)
MIRQAGDMKVEVRDRMRGGAGQVNVRHWLQKEDFKANVRLCAKLTIPPGAGIGTHPHEKEDEVYVILRGSGLLHDGTRETRVSAGDAILTGNGGAHAIRNDGPEDLEIAAMIVGY